MDVAAEMGLGRDPLALVARTPQTQVSEDLRAALRADLGGTLPQAHEGPFVSMVRDVLDLRDREAQCEWRPAPGPGGRGSSKECSESPYGYRWKTTIGPLRSPGCLWQVEFDIADLGADSLVMANSSSHDIAALWNDDYWPGRCELKHATWGGIVREPDFADEADNTVGFSVTRTRDEPGCTDDVYMRNVRLVCVPERD